MELAKTNADVRKLHQEIKKNRWKVSLIDSSQGIDTEERDFGKLQVYFFSVFKPFLLHGFSIMDHIYQ